MNKKICFLPALLLMLLSFASCSQTSEVTQYDNWQPRNQAVLDSLQKVVDSKSNPNLFVITPMSNQKLKIYAEKVDGYVATGERPLDTDTVQVYYRGKLINGELFDQDFSGTNPDPNFDIPAKYPVYSEVAAYHIITGWTEVLRLMKKGERWVVYIPYQLAYGTAGSGAILGYSTLIFDMNLYNYWSPKRK
jgi:FKBP-type peptidyl-prolyl cis-trans isomerase FklB